MNKKDGGKMKLKKSTSSIMLVVVMLLTLVSSSLVFADTVDYAGALSQFQSAGIIDSSITDGNSTVTRGQFVKSIAVADNLASTASGLTGSTIFPDIDADSELSGYINAAVNAGLMSGLADGNFHPEQPVTYAQACTVMVKLLGYTDSDVTGVWPNNYIQKAGSLDLTTDITLKKSDNLTAKVEAVLFDRLFNTVMKKTGPTDPGKFFADVYYTDTTVTGTLGEYLILGNSKTNDNLNDNQILTDKGTLTLQQGAISPTIGGKYKLYVNGSTVTKVSVKENTLENYAVKSVSGSSVTYTDDNGDKQMVLPKAAVYYYHGSYLSYDEAAAAIQAYSSLILAKDSNSTTYNYAVIVDPYFGQPIVYKYGDEQIIAEVKAIKNLYISQYGYWYTNSDYAYANLADGSVVYPVSDLWGKNNFGYVINSSFTGKITAITPSRFNPTSIVVNGTTYQVSQYFNKNRLNSYDNNNIINVNSIKKIILGIDGKILDIY